MRQRTFKFVLAAAMVTVVSCPAAVASGGTVVKVEGTASVERGGRQLPLAEPFPVQSGDTVKVAEQSKVQLHFQDDSVFALASGTDLRIEQFTLARKENAGSAIFSLLRGGLRTITGLIGKGTRDTYEMRTPMATIGIRGSAYSAILCASTCSATGKFKAGLYLYAESGLIIVGNTAGKLNLKAGQTAYVASNTSAPVLVRISPFSDPQFSADFGIDLDFDVEVHPPRIEQDPPASPS
jgi:hypothetical protein